MGLLTHVTRAYVVDNNYTMHLSMSTEPHSPLLRIGRDLCILCQNILPTYSGDFVIGNIYYVFLINSFQVGLFLETPGYWVRLERDIVKNN